MVSCLLGSRYQRQQLCKSRTPGCLFTYDVKVYYYSFLHSQIGHIGQAFVTHASALHGNELQTTPQPAARPPPSSPSSPSFLLPLSTALAKLQHDPRQLLGWELRLSQSSTRDDDDAVGNRRGRGRRKRPSEDDKVPVGSSVWGRSLGRIVEVLTAAAAHSPAKADTAASSSASSSAAAAAAGVASPASSPAAKLAAQRRPGGPAAVATPAHHHQQQQQRTAAMVATAAATAVSSPGTTNRQQPQQQQQPQVMLRAVLHTVVQQYDFEGSEEYVVRLDPAVLPYAEMASRTLIVQPPAGLLEQGRRSLLLQLLRRELRTLQPPPVRPRPQQGPPAGQGSQGGAEEGVEGGVEEVSLVPSRDDVSRMPTRRHLLEAGRADLVGLVTEAGGFGEVALQLGLRCARRPPGYWSGPDSWERLAEELAAFVGGGWVELPHPDDPGRCYYYNQISHRTIWRRPPPLQRLPTTTCTGGRATHQRPTQPQRAAAPGTKVADEGGGGGGGGGAGGRGVRWVLAEAAADRVMPSRAVVMQARRVDLHNAIVFHGGYLQVAAALGRRVTWSLSKYLYDSPAAVRRELAAVARELQLPPGELPSPRDLRQSGHGALLTAVRRYAELAALMPGVRRRRRGSGGDGRRPRGRWDDPNALATELYNFVARTAAAAATPPPPPSGGDASSDAGGAAAAITIVGGGGADEASSASGPPQPPRALWSAGVNGGGGGGGSPGCHTPRGREPGEAEEVPHESAAGAVGAGDADADASDATRRRRGRPRKPPCHQPQVQPHLQQHDVISSPDSASTETRGSQQPFAAAAAAPPPPPPPRMPRSGSSRCLDPAAAAAEPQPGSKAAEPLPRGQPPPPPARMPSLRQLRAAGRHDLVYAITVRHGGRREQLAQLAGLQLLRDGRGTNRNALSLEAVVGAIQAGCHTPKAIREHLRHQLRIEISRQYLTTYLARMAAKGWLTKLSYGRYGTRLADAAVAAAR